MGVSTVACVMPNPKEKISRPPPSIMPTPKKTSILGFNDKPISDHLKSLPSNFVVRIYINAVTATRSMMPKTICESVISFIRPITLKIMRFKTTTTKTEKANINRVQYGLTFPILFRNS